MKLLIDNKPVETRPGKTILEAALDGGVYIPHLCKHPDLEAAGGCRLCVVEIAGREGAVPACETPAEEGMEVSTRTELTEHIRRMSMELMLASHPSECTDCPKYGNCELQSLYQYLNASAERWRTKSRPVPENADNPLIRHLFTRCIRCGRCVRACNSLRGVKVLDYRRKKLDVRIGTEGGVSLAEAGCRFCGACVEVCPTGAITDAVGSINPDLPRFKALVPCRSACPGGVDVPAFLRKLAKEDYAGAAAVIRERVPFPGVLGSVCTHPCEAQCRRGAVNQPISICRLKRVAAQAAGAVQTARKPAPPKAGRSCAVVGGGPAGLTAAWLLARQGCSVTVFEAEPKAGGQLRMGIPAYRLPDAVLDAEVEAILAEGVTLRTSSPIARPANLLMQGYDAVLVAVGTHRGTVLPLEGRDLPGVLVNTQFLRAARLGPAPAMGRRVVVLGGGNVALDCARTALRLGAEKVFVACLEDRGAMTASAEEIEDALAEGVVLHNSVTFRKIQGEAAVTGVLLQQVAGFHFDEHRRAVVEPVPDSEHILPADSVIFAVGQVPAGTEEMGLPLSRGTYLAAGPEGATQVPGVFAAGDVVTGTRSVIEAVAAGRAAAQAMGCFLGIGEQPPQPVEAADTWLGRVEGFAALRREEPSLRPPCERLEDFGLVEVPLSCEQAVKEAGRCLQCDLRLSLGQNKFWNEYTEQKEGSAP